jgi:hypothetical protein
MTWCESQVARFNSDIKLDSERKKRIDGAIDRFQNFCTSDEQLKIATSGSAFLQGSVATGTVIRPLGDGEFDVDVVYPFNFHDFDSSATPDQIISWFVSRLQQSEFYKNRLIPRDRCARIDYAGDFHVDIIPATQSIPQTQPYAVPVIRNDLVHKYLSYLSRKCRTVARSVFESRQIGRPAPVSNPRQGQRFCVEQDKQTGSATPRKTRGGEPKNIMCAGQRREESQHGGERHEHIDRDRTAPSDERTPCVAQ